MWKQLKLLVLILICVTILNLYAWLFVNSLDVTTIGSGRTRLSGNVRALISFADWMYPYVEVVPSMQRRIGGLLGLRNHYYLSWLLTIALESCLVTPLVYGFSKVLSKTIVSRA